MKDYKTSEFKGKDNSHYSEPSMYGKIVREQYNMRSKYCEMGKDIKSSANSSPTQLGPKGNHKK